jgi:signal peptidase II
VKRANYLLISLAVIAMDAVTKWMVIRHIDFRQTIEMIPNFFQLVHVQNTGAAFGIGANSASRLTPLLLNGGAIAVFVMVVVYALRSAASDTLLQSALHLILGGAIGNLIDRFRFGSVVDFLDFYIRIGSQDHHWPAFNVADSAICVGIALLFLDMRRKPATDAPQAA